MALCGSSFRVSLHWQLLSRNYKASNRQVLPRIESRNLFVWSVVSLNVLVRRELSWNQKLLDQYRSMYWIISHTIKCIKSAEIAEQNKLNAHLYSYLANTVFLVNSDFFIPTGQSVYATNPPAYFLGTRWLPYSCAPLPRLLAHQRDSRKSLCASTLRETLDSKGVLH